jgi:hypothetical protein
MHLNGMKEIVKLKLIAILRKMKKEALKKGKCEHFLFKIIMLKNTDTLHS